MKDTTPRIPRPTPDHEARALLSVSSGLQRRLASLRRRLESCFGIRLDEDDLMEYLCENALERLEDWADRFPATEADAAPKHASSELPRRRSEP